MICHLIHWINGLGQFVSTRLCSVIRTLHTLVTTISELTTPLRQHHVTNSPPGAEQDSFANESASLHWFSDGNVHGSWW